MATFSENQVRHLYVAKALGSTNAGDISVTANSEDLYFKYIGADGAERTDLIPLSNITQAQAVRYDKSLRQLTKFKVALDATVNGGAPIPGQEYLVRIKFFEWGSLSMDDQYFKHGVVRAYSGMTATQFYTAMAASINLNLSREQIPLLTVTSDANGVYLQEIEQPWTLGTKESQPLIFTVGCGTVLDTITTGNEYTWGVVTKPASGVFVKNGKIVADMEYFYMGERADQYRGVGFPNVIKTTYLVDPTIEYNFIEFDYFYQGSGIDVQKSQKHITLVVPAVGADIATKVALTNSIISAINTATGKTTVAALATT